MTSSMRPGDLINEAIPYLGRLGDHAMYPVTHMITFIVRFPNVFAVIYCTYANITYILGIPHNVGLNTSPDFHSRAFRDSSYRILLESFVRGCSMNSLPRHLGLKKQFFQSC